MKTALPSRVLAAVASTVITIVLFEQVALMGMPAPAALPAVVQAAPAGPTSQA